MRSRWGEPLSFAEADALATRFNEGDLISTTEHLERLGSLVEEYSDTVDKKTRYHKLGQIRAHMEEMGITQLEEEMDENILAQTVCESSCARKCKDLTGPDLDYCYWTCMHSCSPVLEAFVDGSPPPSTVDPDKVGQTVYSIAPSGLLVPKHGKKRV